MDSMKQGLVNANFKLSFACGRKNSLVLHSMDVLSVN